MSDTGSISVRLQHITETDDNGFSRKLRFCLVIRGVFLRIIVTLNQSFNSQWFFNL